ncbi:MAG: glycosyl transferase [Rhodobacterales bacterium]|nr:MAG: glycosyl transferase [Rhodobacterales bacterium]
MTRLSTSVVVVSAGRPRELERCLTALGQIYHPAAELIVVADAQGREAVRRHPLADHIRLCACDEPNISVARNIGIAAAAGEIIAFIDDDSVPEPLWLWHLTAPFADGDVTAATGYVRGRNGIAFQSRAAEALSDGTTRPIPLSGDAPVALRARPGKGIKTEGTNMAFRRGELAAMGGFDPAFRFYLDETDVNLRLAAAGKVTAIVPLAQVHHGKAASRLRRDDRTPRDLTQIGTSLAVFLRKHAAEARHERIIAQERARQRHRLLRAMRIGRIEPRDVTRLLAGFDTGIAQGRDQKILEFKAISSKHAPFSARPHAPFSPRVITGRLWARRVHQRRSKQALADGATPVCLYLFSRTAIWHRVRFHPDGYWEQRGGLFGRAGRNEPLWRFWRMKARVAHEVESAAPQRGVTL